MGSGRFSGHLRILGTSSPNLEQVTVNPWRNSRLFQRCGSLAFLGLAVFVFTWGLQYKLSLYDPPKSVSHQIPQAKLISEDEQTETTQSPLVVQTKSFPRISYAVTAAVFFILYFPLCVQSSQSAGRVEVNASDFSYLYRGLFGSFLVRPPPTLI